MTFDISLQCEFVVLFESAQFCRLAFVHDASGLRVCESVFWGKMLQTMAVTCSVPKYMGVAQIEYDRLQTEDGWRKAPTQQSTLLKKKLGFDKRLKTF